MLCLTTETDCSVARARKATIGAVDTPKTGGTSRGATATTERTTVEEAVEAAAAAEHRRPSEVDSRTKERTGGAEQDANGEMEGEQQQ